MKTKKFLLHAFGVVVTASTLSLSLAQFASAGVIFKPVASADPIPNGMDAVRFPVTGTITGPDDSVTGVVGTGPVGNRPVIEFTSSTDQLFTTDGGPTSARNFIGIFSPDDDLIQNFSAQLADGVFTSFFYAAFPTTITRNPAGRFATVTVYEADGGQETYTQFLLNNGNRLLITATEGDLITRVDFSTSAQIDSIRQLRIDGVQPSPVPEPSALWLLAAGLLGITLVKRSKTN